LISCLNSSWPAFIFVSKALMLSLMLFSMSFFTALI
jgi:hypothetical protein